ncbi:hypothetical protein NHQ30_002500 [Ciborinia camelliae]|nr:hypothetical protein NHQ30_002500 [Ciborinia camelliae]
MTYFVVASIAGFVLNARRTGILFAAVIPSITLVVLIGPLAQSPTPLTRDREGSTSSSSFDAFNALTNSHLQIFPPTHQYSPI